MALIWITYPLRVGNFILKNEFINNTWVNCSLNVADYCNFETKQNKKKQQSHVCKTPYLTSRSSMVKGSRSKNDQCLYCKKVSELRNMCTKLEHCTFCRLKITGKVNTSRQTDLKQYPQPSDMTFKYICILMLQEPLPNLFHQHSSSWKLSLETGILKKAIISYCFISVSFRV